MRDAPQSSWRRWRVKPVVGPAAPPPAPRFAHRTTSMSAVMPALSATDGIRHDLVARVRAEIAAGTYDTEERWLAAEERLLRRVEQAR
jgi:hypothetical protein